MVRPAELLAATAVVLHEPDLAPPGDLPGVWPLLVLGEAGRRVHVNLARRRPASEPRALRRVGFYVLPGEAGDVLLLDGESPPPDGDGNVFGYELSVGGQRLIVDSGDGGEEAEPWRTYFRSARAHNVMIIKGAEQVVDGRVPLVGDVEWVVKDGLRCFAGTHDGFARLSEDLLLRHRRRIFCLPGRFWLVCDEVLGTGVWQAESFLHFHPEIVLSGACRSGPTFMAERSRSARVQVVPGGAAKVRAVHGLVEPNCQGWYAGSVGERRPATVMSLVKAAEAPFVFGYALLPRTNGPATLRFEHDAFHFVATLVAVNSARGSAPRPRRAKPAGAPTPRSLRSAALRAEIHPALRSQREPGDQTRCFRTRASTAFLKSSTDSRSARCSTMRRIGPGTQNPRSTSCVQVALVRPLP
jgi:hypothetical protein